MFIKLIKHPAIETVLWTFGMFIISRKTLLSGCTPTTPFRTRTSSTVLDYWTELEVDVFGDMAQMLESIVIIQFGVNGFFDEFAFVVQYDEIL